MNPSLIPVIDVIAKGIAVLLLVMGILSLWRGASASQRSLVWLLCFGTLLLLPITVLVQPWWSLEVAEASTPAAVVAMPTAPPPVQLARAPLMGMPVPTEAPSTNVEAVSAPLSVLQILAVVWVSGASLVFLGRVVGSVRLQLLKSQTMACKDERVLGLTSGIKQELQIRREVDLRTSRAVSVPMTWGVRRPMLLLPEEALTWSSQELDAALRHELGHIRHWDALTRGIMTLVCAMYWFNPLVWLAAKRWRTAQEQASDDLVVNHGDNAEAYAMQLLNAARHVQQSGFMRLPAMTMAQASTLETRLSAIMDASKNRRPVRRAALLAGGGVAAGMFLACASLQLQAAAPPSVQAGGKYVVIDCVVAECVGEDAIGKVAAMSVKHSGLRKGAESLPADLATLPGVRFFASGRTYAPLEAETGVNITRAVADGGGLSIPFNVFPVLVPDGAVLMIRRPMKELPGVTTNIGASVRASGEETVVTLRPNGLVALDGGEARGVNPRRKYIYLLAARSVQADANGNLPASGPAPGIVGGPDGLDGNPSIKQRASRQVIIPSVELKNATMVEVIEYLRAQAKQHDPTGQGITLHLSEGAARSNVRVTLSLKKSSLTMALAAVLKNAEPVVDLRLHQEDNSFWISTRTELEDQGDVPRRVSSAPPSAVAPRPAEAAPSSGSGALQRAQNIILPSVEFNGATLKEAVEFFRVKGRANDTSGKGVDIVLGADTADSTVRLTLSLKNVPLSEALRYTADLSNFELTADEFTMFFKKKGDTKSEPKAGAPVKSDAWEKAGKIILPKVKFSHTTVSDAVEFLNIKAKEVDPEKQGVNILIAPDKSGRSGQITLDLVDVPLSEAVRYVAELAGMEVVAEKSALYLRPKTVEK